MPFNGFYNKVMSPCMGCPNRFLGCHSKCEKFQTYEAKKTEETLERVKSKEGIGGVVLRQSAILG